MDWVILIAVIAIIALVLVCGLGVALRIKAPIPIIRESDDTELEEQRDTIALLNREIGQLREVSHELLVKVQETTTKNNELTTTLAIEVEKSRKILSQKKSSETRLGQISEHLAPFLGECPHDPKNMHFLGNPIDFVVFDYDAGEIVFLEVKSGNSQESKRQKTIKNMIKSGHVYYEKMRISDKAVKYKREDNDG